KLSHTFARFPLIRFQPGHSRLNCLYTLVQICADTLADLSRSSLSLISSCLQIRFELAHSICKGREALRHFAQVVFRGTHALAQSVRSRLYTDHVGSSFL